MRKKSKLPIVLAALLFLLAAVAEIATSRSGVMTVDDANAPVLRSAGLTPPTF